MATITAKNYAAQALKEFIDIANTKQPLLSVQDRETIPRLILALKAAEHFVLPDGGKLLNDRYKGIAGEEIHLPYPVITIETFMPIEAQILKEHQIAVTKRLVVAIDLRQYAQVNNYPSDTLENGGILIYPLDYMKNCWQPAMVGALIAFNWDKGSKIDVRTFEKPPKDHIAFYAHLFPMFPGYFSEYCKTNHLTLDEGLALERRNINDEVHMVLELCEALSCKNVSAVVYQPASPANAKRLKAGKVPILETKILSVAISRTVSVGTGQTIEGRKSPHEHLRMGHPR